MVYLTIRNGGDRLGDLSSLLYGDVAESSYINAFSLPENNVIARVRNARSVLVAVAAPAALAANGCFAQENDATSAVDESIVALTSLLASVPVRSHHTFATEYERERMITVDAVVTAVHFRNPHVRLDLLVMTDREEQQVWVANSVSPGVLSHRGWLQETISVGDRVTLHGNPGSNDSKRLWIQTVTLENGIEINPVGRVPAHDDVQVGN